ncbi:hypothetical protein F5Y13DRAFT_205594 [Hypoxylon sp. FL1857]|nr:hypothetical protein F5Y13DRAFT_205594 [Hypoxylon sp. FL1857]
MLPKTTPRKKEWEYSTNKNTIRARQRKARLNPYQRETEQAKAADHKSVTRALKIHSNTDTFKMATDDERKMLLESIKQEVMEQRKKKGIDAESKERQFIARQKASINGLGSPPTPDSLASYPTMPSAGVGPAIAAPVPVPGYGLVPFSNYQGSHMAINQHMYGNDVGTNGYGGYGSDVVVNTPSSQHNLLQQGTYENNPSDPAALDQKPRIELLEEEVTKLKEQLATTKREVEELKASMQLMGHSGDSGLAAHFRLLAHAAATVAYHLDGAGAANAEHSSDQSITENGPDHESENDDEYEGDMGSHGEQFTYSGRGDA